MKKNLKAIVFTISLVLSYFWGLGQTQISSFAYPEDFEDLQFSHIANNDSIAFFTIKEAATGNELWVTDGTNAGTFLLKDFTKGDNSTYDFKIEFLENFAIIVVGMEIYKFSLENRTNLFEPWIKLTDVYVFDLFGIEGRTYMFLDNIETYSRSIVEISLKEGLVIVKDSISSFYRESEVVIFSIRNSKNLNDVYLLQKLLLPLVSNTPYVPTVNPILYVEDEILISYPDTNRSLLFAVKNQNVVTSFLTGSRDELLPSIIKKINGSFMILNKNERNKQTFEIKMKSFYNGKFESEQTINVENQEIFEQNYQKFATNVIWDSTESKLLFFNGSSLFSGLITIRSNEIDLLQRSIRTKTHLKNKPDFFFFKKVVLKQLDSTNYDLSGELSRYTYNKNIDSLTRVESLVFNPPLDSILYLNQTFDLKFKKSLFSIRKDESTTLIASQMVKSAEIEESKLLNINGKLVLSYIDKTKGEINFYKYKDDIIIDSIALKGKRFNISQSESGKEMVILIDSVFIGISLDTFANLFSTPIKNKSEYVRNVYSRPEGVLIDAEYRWILAKNGKVFDLGDLRKLGFHLLSFENEFLFYSYSDGLFLIKDGILKPLLTGVFNLVDSKFNFTLLSKTDKNGVSTFYKIDSVLNVKNVNPMIHSVISKYLVSTLADGNLQFFDVESLEEIKTGRISSLKSLDVTGFSKYGALISDYYYPKLLYYLPFNSEEVHELSFESKIDIISLTAEGFYFSKNSFLDNNRWYFDLTTFKEYFVYSGSYLNIFVPLFSRNAVVLKNNNSEIIFWSPKRKEGQLITLPNSGIEVINPNGLGADFILFDWMSDKHYFKIEKDSALFLFKLPYYTAANYSIRVANDNWYTAVSNYNAEFGQELNLVSRFDNKLMGEIVPGSASPTIAAGTWINNDLYVFAYTREQGYQLWKYADAFSQNEIVSGQPLSSHEIGENDLIVFPNPFHIELQLSKDFNNYEIYSTTGFFVQKGKIESDKIHLSNLETGTYILKLIGSNNQVEVKRVVKF